MQDGNGRPNSEERREVKKKVGRGGMKKQRVSKGDVEENSSKTGDGMEVWEEGGMERKEFKKGMEEQTVRVEWKERGR